MFRWQSICLPFFFLLGIIAFPNIAVSDDPCRDANEAVTKVTTALSQQSIADVQQGKFSSKNVNGDHVISYLVKGKPVFQMKYPYESSGPGDDISEMRPVVFKGQNALFINHSQGTYIHCDFIIFFSQQSNRFVSRALDGKEVAQVKGSKRAESANPKRQCDGIYDNALTICSQGQNCDDGMEMLPMAGRGWIESLSNKAPFDQLCKQVCRSRQMPDRKTFGKIICGGS